MLAPQAGDPPVIVTELGRELRYGWHDLVLYHGHGFPGGVAHALRVMQRALPIVSPDGPPERREIRIRTAFRGPGARDAFEMMTRAVTEGRYHVDPALERPERGPTLERYVFEVGYRDRSVVLVIREGIVDDEFVRLGRLTSRTAEEELRLEGLKLDMARRLLALEARETYIVVAR
ncbi:MAG: hypothetical protein MUF07_02325 [Steroidobacteraceae bacterium]|jgi:hypothetical protein|nr:hypothetical protein [Steroidobacteraceae bacterium]